MSDQKNSPSMFSKENYTWMLIGIAVIALGMFLMSGGTSNKDPNVFDKDAVYSARRITIAPLLILAGLVIEIYAIFKKPRLNAARQAKETVG
ncbi:MAG: DUF3098 domain-containing protein [Bacteroidota bacterium]